MAGAGRRMDDTRTMVSVWSQANIQSKLDSVSRNLSNFEDVIREPSRLGHEIPHTHARELERAGHACF